MIYLTHESEDAEATA